MIRLLTRIFALTAFATIAAACSPGASPLAPAGTNGFAGASASIRPICNYVATPSRYRCFSWMRDDLLPDYRTDGIPANAGYTAQEIEQAYHLNVARGARQTVAIVDAYGYTTAASDLTTYRSAAGLPPCTTSGGCLRIVNQDGESGPLPTPNTNPNQDWRPEESLDLDAVSAACPRCHIILVQANTDLSQDLYAGFLAATNLKANVISLSFGGPECCGSNGGAYDQTGRVVVAAAGDDGGGSNYSGGPAMPCDYEYVVCAGGTELVRAANARGWSETVWNDFDVACSGGVRCGATGSGCSRIVPKPSWQTDRANGDCTMRSEVDVSASASPVHGFAVYNTLFGWSPFGGTSLATPLIAGVFALGENAASRKGASQIWAEHKAMYDVTAGNNLDFTYTGDCASTVRYICYAQPGYDGPTGWGSPNGDIDF